MYCWTAIHGLDHNVAYTNGGDHRKVLTTQVSSSTASQKSGMEIPAMIPPRSP